jgi:hypothetical protein
MVYYQSDKNNQTQLISEGTVGKFLHNIFKTQTNNYRDYGFFQQDGANAHTECNSMTASWKIFWGLNN